MILCTVTVVVSLKIVPLSNDVRNEYTSLDYVPSGAQFLYRPDSPQLNLNNRERRATSQNVISTNFAFTNDQNPYALIYFSGDKSSVRICCVVSSICLLVFEILCVSFLCTLLNNKNIVFSLVYSFRMSPFSVSFFPCGDYVITITERY